MELSLNPHVDDPGRSIHEPRPTTPRRAASIQAGDKVQETDAVNWPSTAASQSQSPPRSVLPVFQDYQLFSSHDNGGHYEELEGDHPGQTYGHKKQDTGIDGRTHSQLASAFPGSPHDDGQIGEASGRVTNTTQTPHHDSESELPTYFNTLDEHGIEGDFCRVMKSQKKHERSRGRVAVLNMDRSTKVNLEGPPEVSRDDCGQMDYVPPYPDYEEQLRDGSMRKLRPGAPEGFLFEDLGQFERAIKLLHPAKSELTVTKFFEKQLVIIEDLGRDWIAKLGVEFHIPAHVFAFHWVSPSSYIRGRVRLPLGQASEDHFIMPYREVLPFTITEKRISETPWCWTVVGNMLGNNSLHSNRRCILGRLHSSPPDYSQQGHNGRHKSRCIQARYVKRDM